MHNNFMISGAVLLKSAPVLAVLCFLVNSIVYAAGQDPTQTEPTLAPADTGQKSNQSTSSSTTEHSAQPQEVKRETPEQTYRRGRMAFLFGRYKIAYNIWKPLADDGYAKAQTVMGWIYQTGKGADKNDNTAFSWYEKAALQNNEIAQNNLGVLYENGWGVGKNESLAAKWYREAAEWGYSYAQYNLGILYLEGRGVEKDVLEAQFWLQIAALQGVKQAQDTLLALKNKYHPAKIAGNTSELDGKSKISSETKTPPRSSSQRRSKRKPAPSSSVQTTAEKSNTDDWLNTPVMKSWFADAQQAQQKISGPETAESKKPILIR
jgi:TPR repeat protein